MKLIHMHSTSFNWMKWRVGSPANFKIPCRKEILIANGNILRKYAIGYIEGEKLLCRPKRNYTAIMFFKDEEEFWFHLRNDEFKIIFEKT